MAGCATASPTAPLQAEVVVERSRPKRPAWIGVVPESTATTIAVIGRAEGPTESGVLIDARENTARQVVDTFYGSDVTKRYERVRAEVGRRVTDKLVSTSEGKVVGARTREVYWERVQVNAAAGVVRYYYRGYVWMDVDRKRLETAVRRWFGGVLVVFDCRSTPEGGCDDEAVAGVRAAAIAAGLELASVILPPAGVTADDTRALIGLGEAHGVGEILWVRLRARYKGSEKDSGGNPVMYAFADISASLRDGTTGVASGWSMSPASGKGALPEMPRYDHLSVVRLARNKAVRKLGEALTARGR